MTIDTMSPYFTEPNPVIVDVATLDRTSPVITNVGTAPAGLMLDIKFTDPTPQNQVIFGLSTAPTLETFTRYPGFNIINTPWYSTPHSYEVDTRPGYRSVIRKTNDNITRVVALSEFVTPSRTPWVVLHGGVNTFHTLKYYLSGWPDTPWVWNSVKYYPNHWGI